MATWYVRPDTSHSGTRNGASYATAWGGWSEIVAASMAATDALMVCGAHSYSATITSPKAGTSAAGRFILDGGYAADPGSITLTSTAFFNDSRAYVSHRNLTITGAASSLFFLGATGNEYTGCTMIGGGSAVNFSGANGTAYADTNIEGCTIYGQTNAAVNWLVTTAAALSTMSTLTIRNNEMYGQTQDQVIHLRTQSGVAAGSIMSGIVIDGNTIRNAQGVGIRAVHAATTAVGGSITVTNNTISDLTEGASAVGGGMAIVGFTGVFVNDNTITDVVGVYGGCNVIYCAGGLIERNTVNGCTSSTIDANGILIDHACTSFVVRRNSLTNCLGKTGVLNSGAGVMVLDASGIDVYSNVISGCRIGYYIGAAGPAAQQADFYGNTVLSPTVYGIFVNSAATRADLTAKNNVFVGSVPLVFDQTTGGWTGEDYNVSHGMTASTAHTNGANNSTAAPQYSDAYRPTPGSPLLTDGADLGYMRDMDGRQSRGHIGAYGAATLRRVLTTDPA